jgi:hypothetical protein
MFVSATTAYAQSAGRRPLIRGGSRNAVPASTDKPTDRVAATSGETHWAEPDGQQGQKKTIAGSWLGTAGDGSQVLASYTSDGIVSASVQGEVSLNPAIPILSPSHGAWTQVGGRQFAVTVIGMFYDGITFELMGFLKVQLFLTLDPAGDQMSGTDKVQIFDPAGNLIEAMPTGNVHYARIKPEPTN